MDELDFGYNPNDANEKTDVKPDGSQQETKETKTDIDGGNPEVDNLDNKGDSPDSNNEEKDNSNAIELVEGQTVDIDGTVYTVDKDGNLLDKDNNVAVKAEEVQNFLKDYVKSNEEEHNNAITLASIQKAVDVEIVDENGNAVEFENTPDGVKSYIDSVISLQKEDLQKEAINTVFNRYPILNDVLNYYLANGNSLEGFGTSPDRTNITLDEKNEEQQENIIRTAWKEQNRTGDVESYINYLKNSGILYASAKTELEGLQAKDKSDKERLAKEAQEAEKARIEELQNYWNGVKNVIDSKKIAGYTIPDTIVRSIDNRKINASPTDFFNYLYRVDKDGNSQYSKDLDNLSPEARRDDEILRAYLLFTGGSYKDLVQMAINEKQVKTLKLQAKNKANNSVKFTAKKDKSNGIDLGY